MLLIVHKFMFSCIPYTAQALYPKDGTDKTGLDLTPSAL